MAKPDADNSLKRWIDMLVERTGISQARIGRACGWSPDYFSKILTEPRRQLPERMEVIARVVSRFTPRDISTDDLAERPPANEPLRPVSQIQLAGEQEDAMSQPWRKHLAIIAETAEPDDIIEEVLKIKKRRQARVENPFGKGRGR